MKDNDSFILQI